MPCCSHRPDRFVVNPWDWPRDWEGQRNVLLKVLDLLEKGESPGEVRHLPFTWPEEPKETDWHPPEMSPIVRAYIKEIKAARKREAETLS